MKKDKSTDYNITGRIISFVYRVHVRQDNKRAKQVDS